LIRRCSLQTEAKWRSKDKLRGGEPDFDAMGNQAFHRQGKWLNLKYETYAAYAEKRLKSEAEQLGRWVGLGEELPNASAAPDVMGVLPPKRMFRLFKSGALE